MTRAHTPGSWTVSPLNGRDVGPVRAFTFEGTDVQQLQSVPIVRERAESDANARLIAAAPALYEAARHAVMEWRLHGSLTDSCRVLEAAVAKAEERG